MTALTATPEQPLVMMTLGDFRQVLTEAVCSALRQQKEEVEAEKRLTSEEAARFLGCTTDNLQRLHRKGLPYEKGKPNYYRLADLKTVREQRRLTRST